MSQGRDPRAEALATALEVVAKRKAIYEAKAEERDPFAEPTLTPHDVSTEIALAMDFVLADLRAALGEEAPKIDAAALAASRGALHLGVLGGPSFQEMLTASKVSRALARRVRYIGVFNQEIELGPMDDPHALYKTVYPGYDAP